MLKKIAIACAAIVAAIAFSSCGTPKAALGNGLLGGGIQGQGAQTGVNANQNNQGAGVGNMLGSLLSGLIGQNTQITEKTLYGTWTYVSPDCRFTSENALMQAGGEFAAATVEDKLAGIYQMVGIVPGACSFTFNQDKTCQIDLGGRVIAGTYAFNPETRELNIVSTTGLIKLNATVYYDYSQLTILFDAHKLLSAVQMVAAFTGQGSQSAQTLSQLLNNYSGMMIGMNLAK